MQKITSTHADTVGWTEAVTVFGSEDLSYDDKALAVAKAMSWADRYLLTERNLAEQDALLEDAKGLLELVGRLRNG